jgi:hypothetical protein
MLISNPTALACRQGAERLIRAPRSLQTAVRSVMARAAGAEFRWGTAVPRLHPPVVDDRKIVGIDETTTTIADYWPYAATLFDYIRRDL